MLRERKREGGRERERERERASDKGEKIEQLYHIPSKRGKLQKLRDTCTLLMYFLDFLKKLTPAFSHFRGHSFIGGIFEGLGDRGRQGCPDSVI